jgi:hypothetical protein
MESAVLFPPIGTSKLILGLVTNMARRKIFPTELQLLATSEAGTTQEIANFLQALSSYPACFAMNPDISFEEYFSVISARTNLAAFSSLPNYRN